MGKELIVRPDKNEFLLYAMLDSLGLARGNPDSHFLRRKTLNNFKGYEGLGLKQEDYGHHSKPAGFVLTLSEAPKFVKRRNLELSGSMKGDVNRGKTVLPHLKHFYNTTNFEEFYASIIPRYNEECMFLQEILDQTRICSVLDDIWEVKESINMVVIPMPLESVSSGVGPGIGNTSYQIVGPPFDYRIVRLIAHEGSHPRAKKILLPIIDQINKKEKLLEYALNQPNYPNTYHYWPTCFEEHFIRAMQAGFINPVIGNGSNIEEILKNEEKNSGMIFINDFYEVIRNYKLSNKGDLSNVALNILDRLEQKYIK